MESWTNTTDISLKHFISAQIFKLVMLKQENRDNTSVTEVQQGLKYMIQLKTMCRLSASRSHVQ